VTIGSIVTIAVCAIVITSVLIHKTKQYINGRRSSVGVKDTDDVNAKETIVNYTSGIAFIIFRSYRHNQIQAHIFLT